MTEEIEKTPGHIPSRVVKQQNPILPVILSVCSLFVALAALIIVFVTARPGGAPAGVSVAQGDIRIAWVNSDTIWNNYEFVADVKEELAKYEGELQDQYKATVMAFEKDYKNYLQTGSTLSLAQQQKKEEELARRQQSIQELDATLTQQLVDEKTARNMEVHDTIVNFISRFNKEKQYTFILERSYAGNVMYADPGLEITATIIKGLNEEYRSFRKVN